uniref:Putative glutathione peroxidase n=1 Tax=Amblyomma triste TaxID=251400 RepID=A0A023G6J2_AMBTT
MLTRLLLALMCAAAGTAGAQPRKADCYRRVGPAGELYNFQVPDILGKCNVTLDQYRGHVLLVVNVATY